jgi:hypothetical protein
MNIALIKYGVFSGGLYVIRYNVILIYERGVMTFITEWFSSLTERRGEK